MNYSDVPRETQQKIDEYKKILFFWNNKVNLISKNIDIDFHIANCLELLLLLKDPNVEIVDVGSGNGLPGLILSLFGFKQITLVEPNYKKATFLLQASRILGSTVSVIEDKIENVSLSCDIVISKAFANAQKLIDCCNKIIIKDKYLLLATKKSILGLDESRYKITLYDSKIWQEGKIIEIK